MDESNNDINNFKKDESFRDSIATIDAEGHRKWIFPKKPKGKFYKYRTYVSYLFLLLFFSVPLIRIGGEPLLMINIVQRKFIIFGQIFWPEDFYLFAIGMLTFAVFIILFTVVFGRLFCGWVCPQTIFMEMVFRKIEYWIEGDFKQQRLLKKTAWNTDKICKKVSKHFIFFCISFIIANTFLAYIIGSDELIKIMSDYPSNHISGLIAILVFTSVFYGVYARFREQVCLVVCPYGRLQGVLLDKKSISIAYDYIRGEKRAKIHKNEDRKVKKLGDCIDCHHCVDVCPTGIDIRNGLQMECVNCTACMDACDEMMENVGLKKGLIRYASEDGIAKNEKLKVTPRTIGYSFVLLSLSTVWIVLLLTRTPVESIILRSSGTLYQAQQDGRISNLYNYSVINKTNNAMPVKFILESPKGEIKLVKDSIYLNKQSVAEGSMFVILDSTALSSYKVKIKIGVYSNGKKLETVSTNFLGPG